jgi:hypothetical protein
VKFLQQVLILILLDILLREFKSVLFEAVFPNVIVCIDDFMPHATHCPGATETLGVEVFKDIETEFEGEVSEEVALEGWGDDLGCELEGGDLTSSEELPEYIGLDVGGEDVKGFAHGGDLHYGRVGGVCV